MRLAPVLAVLAVLAACAAIGASSIACAAFSPEVGPLRDKADGACDESGEYGADAASSAAAGDDAGCGGDS